MDLNVVSKLIEMLEKSKLNILEIEEGEFKIKLEKENVKFVETQVQSAPAVTYVNQAQEPAQITNVVEQKKEDINENYKVVKSPIVGTYYSSSSPTSDAFVKVGSTVKKGQILCIIEAMKLMNEIESDENGEIVEILVENGEMVEYGQPLFKIK